MYEERKNEFSLKGIVLQILTVVLLVFMLLWLFPTKSYIKNYVDDTFVNKLQPLYNQIYAQNLNSMKEAAISYFTTDRLPSKVGDSVTMTLGEMQQKKLVLDLKDTNNKSCSTTDSYVKLTKKDNEYVLTVKLSCSDVTDYIDVYLGCYSYCESGVCESKKPTPKPTKPTSTVKYLYEYEKITNGKWGEWSDWSEWGLKEYTQTEYRRVETKQSTVQTGTELTYKDANKSLSCATGTLSNGKCYVTTPVSTTDTKDASCPTGYSNAGSKQCVKANTVTPVCDTANGYYLYQGTKCRKDGTTTYVTPVCSDSRYKFNGTTCVYTHETGEYTEWKYYNTIEYSTTKKSTDTVRYTLLYTSINTNCGTGCTERIYTYYVETRTAKTVTDTLKPVCTNGDYDETSHKCKVVSSADIKTPTCPSKYELQGGTCLWVEYVPKNVCPTGYKYNDSTSKCVKEIVVVKTETKDPIITYSCDTANGYKLSGNKCVKSIPTYTTYTYYRYQTREFISGNRDIKWSYSKADKALLDAGYVLTGNKKVAK